MAYHNCAGLLPLLLFGASCLAADTQVPLPIDRVEVHPGRTAIQVGDSMQLRAVIQDVAGVVRPGDDVLWLSSDTAIAQIESTGLVRGKRAGTVFITATSHGVAGHAEAAIAPAILVGAGDIADCSSQGDEETAALLDAISGTVFTAGDNAYESGTPDQFSGCYDPSWGRHKSRTRPAPGNHDYLTPGAAGYFAYFASAAGDSTKGYYSYDLGSWHIVVMNTSALAHAGSPQEQWLRADLAAHDVRCTLAYWHYPRFSSGFQGNHVAMQAIWQVLYDAGADVVISGHDHDYERFAPQTPAGLTDANRGIREFVVGTGGRNLLPFNSTSTNSEVRDNTTLGVLLLKLYDGRYEWEFIPTQRAGFTDTGADNCH